MELLLSLVEIMQYKAEFSKIIKIMDEKIELKSINEALFSQELITKLSDGSIVVKSTMIQNGFYSKNVDYKANGDQSEFITRSKRICLAMYHKYISEESELEVNISGENRGKLEQLMDREDYFMDSVNINVNELYQIFDDVAVEMFKLLNFAYTRFVYTPEYLSITRTTLTKTSSQTPVTTIDVSEE